MRITIVRPDNLVCVDGFCFSDIDMSSIPPDIVAVQWYDTFGEIESMLPTGRPSNTPIVSMDPYQDVISQWVTKKAAHDAQ